jgi:hypothetical protein
MKQKEDHPTSVADSQYGVFALDNTQTKLIDVGTKPSASVIEHQGQLIVHGMEGCISSH